MTSPGHLLLVDDDASFVEITVEILQQQGYVVTTATSAQDALARLAADGAAFDVVLLDQRLRGSGGGDGGLELIPRVAELAPFSKTIMITGYAAPEAVERAFILGAYDYLEKGNIFEALLKAKVRNAVEVASETRRAGLTSKAAVAELSELGDRKSTV